jgi:hypothetical protein
MVKKTIFLVCCAVLCCQCLPVNAISDGQKDVIMEKCNVLQDNLKKVQKEDAKVRVYLGGYYEAILTKFITPLNVRLVENGLSSAGFVENQNRFAEAKTLFANDFVKYQQELEELVGTDCEKKPEEFYDRLVITRKKRKIMMQDVLKMRSLISEHIKLVANLKGKV